MNLVEKEEEIILSTNTLITRRRNSCNIRGQRFISNNFECQLISTDLEYETLRKIPQETERILDASNLTDNFHYIPLDQVEKILYLFVQAPIVIYGIIITQKQILLIQNKNEIEFCTSNFMDNGVYVTLGLNDEDIELWDIEKKIKIRDLK